MNNPFTRLAGIAAIAGGLILMVGMIFSLFGESDISYSLWGNIVPVAPMLLAVGAAGLWTLAGGRLAGRLGAATALAGGIILALGLGLMGWLDNEYGWGFMLLGLLLIPVGLTVFGFATRRAQLLPRWNGLPLLIGLFFALGIAWEASEDLRNVPWQQQTDIGFFIIIAAISLGWALLGVVLLGVKNPAPGKLHPA